MGNILPVVEIDLKISKDCGDSGPWETQGVAVVGEEASRQPLELR